MRFVIIDSGIRARRGHNLTFAMLAAREMRRRGIRTTAFTYSKFVPESTDPFRAIGLFSTSYNDVPASDSPAERERSIAHIDTAFASDLAKLSRGAFSPDDLIWVPTISERQLKALVSWIIGFRADRAPRIVINLLLPPGVRTVGDKILVYDTALAQFYRSLLSRHVRFGPNVRLTATGMVMARCYSYLAQRQVDPHPLLVDVAGPLQRPEDRTLLIHVGNAARRKGSHLVPEAIRAIGGRLPDWRFLAHVNVGVHASSRVLVEQLLQVQQDVPSLELRTGFLPPEAHRKLFSEAAAVLLPYDRAFSSRHTSGVQWEAIAAGRPMILTARTYLEQEAAYWGADHVAADLSTSQQIADCLIRTLDGFGLGGSLESATAFREANGIERFADYLLDTKAMPSQTNPRKASRSPG